MNVLQMSFYGAVIVLAVLAIRVLAASRLPKRTFVVLWIVALLRLLLPFEIPSEFSVYSLVNYEFGGDSKKEEAYSGETGKDPLSGSPSAQNASIAMNTPEAQENHADAGQGQETAAFSQGKTEQDAADRMAGKMGQDAAASGKEEGNRGPVSARAAAIVSGLAAWGAGNAGLGGWNAGLAVWGAGAVLCMLFFGMTYVRCRKEFAMSLPVCHAFVEQWMEGRRLSQRYGFMRRFVRRIEVRMSDRIDTPLVYGILRPVILFPKKTDWEEEAQLEYILRHEYTHICCFDTITKLAAVAACCIHWFNPFVWLLYVLLGHDIELACDESVVREGGLEEKTAYANMLIGMEAGRSGIRPLCSSFCRNVIEKRIRSIMTIRRFSSDAAVLAAALVMSVTLVFATSAVQVSGESREVLPGGMDLTEEEYEMLHRLCFEGYEDLPVSDYRRKALAMINTEEYWELLERLFRDRARYGRSDEDEMSEFLFYVLMPLTSLSWEGNTISGTIVGERLETGETPGIVYSIDMRISNANELSVGEYAAASRGMRDRLRAALDSAGEGQRADAEYMRKEIKRVGEELEKTYRSYKLWVKAEVHYRTQGLEEALMEPSISGSTEMSFAISDGKDGASSGTAFTQEDCRSLLSLMEPGYKQKKLVDFNREVLDWAEENPDVWQRFVEAQQEGRLIGEMPVGEAAFAQYMLRSPEDGNGSVLHTMALSEEEKDFILYTLSFSAVENAMWGQGYGKVTIDHDFWYETYGGYYGIGKDLHVNLAKKAEGSDLIWNSSYVVFSYYAAGGERVTVGERDRCVGGMLDAIHTYWEGLDMGDIVYMDKGNLGVKINELSKAYSSQSITISPVATGSMAGWSEYWY